MGSLLSKLLTRPTKELLKDLQEKIAPLEEYEKNIQHRRRVLVPELLAYSKSLYAWFTFAFILLWYFEKIENSIYYWIFIVLCPFLIGGINNFLQWHLFQELQRTKDNLLELKKEKKSLLESAKETGSYKEVQELLYKYGDKKMIETKRAEQSAPSSSSFADMKEEVPDILIGP